MFGLSAAQNTTTDSSLSFVSHRVMQIAWLSRGSAFGTMTYKTDRQLSDEKL